MLAGAVTREADTSWRRYDPGGTLAGAIQVLPFSHHVMAVMDASIAAGAIGIRRGVERLPRRLAPVLRPLRWRGARDPRSLDKRQRRRADAATVRRGSRAGYAGQPRDPPRNHQLQRRWRNAGRRRRHRHHRIPSRRPVGVRRRGRVRRIDGPGAGQLLVERRARRSAASPGLPPQRRAHGRRRRSTRVHRPAQDGTGSRGARSPSRARRYRDGRA